MGAVSPLAAAATTTPSDLIVEITSSALAQLLALRNEEPEAERLGLRLEIASDPGEDFRYDLSFDVVTKAAFSDEVRSHDGLKVIVPAKDVELLRGAVLDHDETAGLVIRNPNRPAAPDVEGLIRGDELSAAIETVVAEQVNPALASHGGFVTYVGHDGEGTAFLTMGGGCHGCAMSRMTMLEGVQTMIVETVPGVRNVKDLTDHTSGENPFYR